MIYRLADRLDLVCIRSRLADIVRYSRKKKTYSALDGNDTSRAKVKISRVQSQPVWYFAPRLLDSLRRLVGPFDQIPKIAGRGEARPGRARGPWPDIRKGRLGDGRVGELDCRVVQQDTARPGRRGRGGHEVELGGGLGAGQEGEGGEQAGEVVWWLGSGCGLLEPGDGSSDAEEDGAEAFWALEYVGGVWMADVPVLETGGLHEEAEGAVGGGHGGGRKWRAAKRCQQIPRPRLLFLFSSSRTSPYNLHYPLLQSSRPPYNSHHAASPRHARHPPHTLPRATPAGRRAPRRPRRPAVRPTSQEEAPRRRPQPHHCRGRQVQAKTYAVPAARAAGTRRSGSQRLGAGKRIGHGHL